MKKKVYFKFLAAMLIISLQACNEENEEPTYTPSQNDAAKVMDEAISKDDGGLMDELSLLNSSFETKDGNPVQLECGVPFDTTLQYTLSGNATGFWTRNWNLLLNCPDNESPFLEISTSYEGNFNGPNQSREREGSRDWTWSNLGPIGDFVYLNGTGNHSGLRTYTANGGTFSWTLATSWTEVAVLKETDQIDSGSGALTLTFTGPQGNTFVYNGTVTFNGDQTATVIINGEEYLIQLG